MNILENVYIGTNVERLALTLTTSINGIEFWETDSGRIYSLNSGRWVFVRAVPLWKVEDALEAPQEGIDTTVLLSDTTGHVVPALVGSDAATYSQTLKTLTVTSTAHNLIAALDGRNVYLENATVSTGVAPIGYSGNWFKNFTYVNANSFTCECENSQTATGTLLTKLTAVTLPITATLKAGAIGTNGMIEFEALTSHNNSAGAKTLSILLNGTSINGTAGSTNVSVTVRKSVRFMNSLQKQAMPALAAIGAAASSSATLIQTIDCRGDVPITVTLRAAVASDYCALDMLHITGKKYN